MSYEAIIYSAIGSGIWAFCEKILAKSCLKSSRLILSKANIATTNILVNHRASFGNLLTRALSSNKDVYLYAIMPQHTLREINSMIEIGTFRVRSLKVMLLNQDLPEVADALGRYWTEPDDKKEQLKFSWEQFKKLQENHREIELRGYNVAPMHQALFVYADWMTIELFPYGAHPHIRPALFLTREASPHLFEQFKSSIENLWKVSTIV